jgi:NAD(P)-dependent dehydrogenase (short-subunit alcohol dehydrogenase family)
VELSFATERVAGHKRVALITGANSGLGKETARALLAAGMRVVCACRSEERGREAVQELLALTKDRPDARADDARVAVLDVASLASVRSFAAAWLAGNEPLHVVCCNAGVMMGPPRRSVDDVDLQLATNYLGHFLLCTSLTPRLVASAPARFVHVTSLAARFGHIEFEHLDPSPAGYDSRRVYGATKLMQLVFSRELNTRLQGTGVTSNSLEPGVVATNLSKGITDDPAMRARLENGSSVQEGAKTQIYLCGSGEVAGRGGGNYVDGADVSTGVGKLRYALAAPSLGADAGARLWAASERLIATKSPT